MQDLLTLRIGSSDFEDAKALARRRGGIPWWIADRSMRCTWERCSFEFLFENKPLTSTHLVPYVALTATVEIQDGVVVERTMGYLRLAKAPLHYFLREESAQSANHGLPVGLTRTTVDKSGTPDGVFVVLNETSSEDQRRRAYAIDVSCLSLILGCAKASSIFPSQVPFQGEPYQSQSANW